MFYFRLAARMGLTVKRLLAEIDSHELAEWQAFDRLEPIDHARRAELSKAIVAATVANGNRDSRTTDPYHASDFMQDWGKEYRQHAEAEGPAIPVGDKVIDMMQAIGIKWE